MFHNPIILSRSSSLLEKKNKTTRYQTTNFWIKLTFRVIWAVKIGIRIFYVSCTYSSVVFEQIKTPTESWVATKGIYANENRLFPARNHRHQQEEHPWKLSIKTITNLTRSMYLNSKPLLYDYSIRSHAWHRSQTDFYVKTITFVSVRICIFERHWTFEIYT